MKPPICDICHKRFSPDEGGLLRFKLTKEDEEFNKRFDQPGYTGHPRGLHWLCAEHKIKLQEFTQLTWSEALDKILKSE